jgi:predicted dehydrogenase
MAIRCLLIGLGQIGMGYDLDLDPASFVYSHTRALSAHQAFELSGAVDQSEPQRLLFERHFKKPAFLNLSEALAKIKPEVIVIATPTNTHLAVLEKVLGQCRPKAILCEKPLAYEPLGAIKMVELCEKAGAKLFVNYMRRSDSGSVELKKRIESGEISLPIKGVAWYSKGFLHNGSHLFNLLEFWLGAFKKAKVLDRGRLLDDQDSEPDVQIEFERGKVVFLAAWEEAFSHCAIELISPSGRLRYENGGGVIAWQPPRPDPLIPGYKILKAEPEIIANGMDRYQYHVADQLANALAGRQHALCTGREALATIEAMHQIIHQKS